MKIDPGRANLDFLNGETEDARAIRHKGRDGAIKIAVPTVFSDNEKMVALARANTVQKQIVGTGRKVQLPELAQPPNRHTMGMVLSRRRRRASRQSILRLSNFEHRFHGLIVVVIEHGGQCHGLRMNANLLLFQTLSRLKLRNSNMKVIIGMISLPYLIACF